MEIVRAAEVDLQEIFSLQYSAYQSEAIAIFKDTASARIYCFKSRNFIRISISLYERLGVSHACASNADK